jgi:hypothetical protein
VRGAWVVAVTPTFSIALSPAALALARGGSADIAIDVDRDPASRAEDKTRRRLKEAGAEYNFTVDRPDFYEEKPSRCPHREPLSHRRVRHWRRSWR